MKERIIILREHPIGCQPFVLGRANCLSCLLLLHPSLNSNVVSKILGTFLSVAFGILLDFIPNQILSLLNPIVHPTKDHAI